jgi:hypothetical protein
MTCEKCKILKEAILKYENMLKEKNRDPFVNVRNVLRLCHFDGNGNFIKRYDIEKNEFINAIQKDIANYDKLTADSSSPSNGR